MTETNDFMTTAEVAGLTRAPESTVRYWRHCGNRTEIVPARA
jgi:hypothetical protein